MEDDMANDKLSKSRARRLSTTITTTTITIALGAASRWLGSKPDTQISSEDKTSNTGTERSEEGVVREVAERHGVDKEEDAGNNAYEEVGIEDSQAGWGFRSVLVDQFADRVPIGGGSSSSSSSSSHYL
ncbi:hypothetical protein AYI68_g4756 [Smittium mucronatum]|uniref:Uncharacterized protein n=1 Tax=Smittium mucronatum TaxID=133383 RepID=A0A1R0GW73_9FUNG|nr:hypothetical protein AYI68_g4756 [Smittium mucronatum]